jgi:hypothetical protein
VAGPGRALLHWQSPASTGGTPLTGYRIHELVGTTAGATVSVPLSSCAAGACAFTLKPLTGGVHYTLHVTAVATAGEGSAATVTTTPQGVPSAPVKLTASLAHLKATLHWSPPTWTGGVTLTGYKLVVVTGSHAAAPLALSTHECAGVHCSFLLPAHLVHHTHYTLELDATNKLGAGPMAKVSFTA